MGLEPYQTCESCLQETMTKDPFMRKGIKAIEILELVHTDVCSLMSHMAIGGEHLFK